MLAEMYIIYIGIPTTHITLHYDFVFCISSYMAKHIKKKETNFSRLLYFLFVI